MLRSKAKRRTLVVRGICAFVLFSAVQAWGQGAWRPDKTTEIIVTTSPGGSNDLVARLMEINVEVA